MIIRGNIQGRNISKLASIVQHELLSSTSTTFLRQYSFPNLWQQGRCTKDYVAHRHCTKNSLETPNRLQILADHC